MWTAANRRSCATTRTSHDAIVWSEMLPPAKACPWNCEALTDVAIAPRIGPASRASAHWTSPR